MFLHIGSDVMVPAKEIIAIINLETIRKGEATWEFLSIAEGERRIEAVVPKNKAKSVVITDSKVYLSPISSNTLRNRSIAFWMEEA